MALPFLDIDIPVCRDFIWYEEHLTGRRMTYDELVDHLVQHFHFAEFRCFVILETLGRYPAYRGAVIYQTGQMGEVL